VLAIGVADKRISQRDGNIKTFISHIEINVNFLFRYYTNFAHDFLEMEVVQVFSKICRGKVFNELLDTSLNRFYQFLRLIFLSYGNAAISKSYILESYGLSRTHVHNFINQRCDKYTLIRFCFALKIRGDLAERFLQKEGFSLKESIRIMDRRIYSILAVSGDYKAFIALLAEEKAKK